MKVVPQRINCCCKEKILKKDLKKIVFTLNTLNYLVISKHENEKLKNLKVKKGRVLFHSINLQIFIMFVTTTQEKKFYIYKIYIFRDSSFISCCFFK